VVAGLGVFLAISGLLTSFMVLATGGRGTRPASKTWSVLGGSLMGAAVGALAGVAMYTADGLPIPDERVARVEAPPAAPPAPAVVTPVAPVAPPPAEAIATLAEAAPPAAAPVPVEAAPPAPVATTPAPTPVAAPAPAPAPTPVATTAPAAAPKQASSASSSSSSRTSSSRPSAPAAEEEAPPRITPSKTTASSSSAAKPAAPPPEAAKSSSTPGVSLTVIDTMIRSNKGVKTCFINEKAESGDLPRGVKVKITIQSSGKVSSANIPSGDWVGTPFDDCLTSAVRGISFPPFEGDPVTMTYPFNI
jgi:hypothetical protein